MYELLHHVPTEEYENFTERGFVTVRISEKCWSGSWTGLTIEQGLQRMTKSKGDHIQYRSIKESVLYRWILGMPATIEICSSMKDYPSVYAYTGEQLVSRISRDNIDTAKVMSWFEAHPPYLKTEKMCSIAMGLVGDSTMNFYDVFGVGDINSSVKNGDYVILVNTALLFQRCSCMVKEEPKLDEYVRYELSPRPLSLFNDEGMRKTNKSVLYKFFELESMNTIWYVVDGGFLLHCVCWPLQSKYHEIVKAYLTYVKKQYGVQVVIVFNGCSQQRCNAILYSSYHCCFSLAFCQCILSSTNWAWPPTLINSVGVAQNTMGETSKLNLSYCSKGFRTMTLMQKGRDEMFKNIQFLSRNFIRNTPSIEFDNEIYDIEYIHILSSDENRG
ncbi:hypothetical protein PR048_018609 [Dryococelus australis]|uniref:Uncharacterized protein n=1 Tax=Dryococelus australis TaxID=614101 RepID=A0ABQ9HCS1_9NEOP|nr:hypothetical protein PR048_018609 [Dryococelus australis]